MPVMRRGGDGYWHYCPACKTEHPLPDKWTFDGNAERPTFSPSFRQFPGDPKRECHYFVRQGVIEYCSDSPHELAGQNVQMPHLEPWAESDEGIDS